MKIYVSGATSVIGSRIIRVLKLKGYSCVSIGRKEAVAWRFGESFPSTVNPTSEDILIHLAHDRTLSLSENIESASRLFETFPGFIIFASSLSAHTRSKSLYGKSKYAIENLLQNNQSAILRIGLYVDSNGGFLQKLIRNISTSILIPLPNGGSYPIYFCPSQALTKLVLRLVESRRAGIFLCATKESITLRQLVEAICQDLNRAPRLVPIPKILSSFFLLLPIQLGRRFVMLDSLRSSLSEPDQEEISQMTSLGIDFSSPEKNLIPKSRIS